MGGMGGMYGGGMGGGMYNRYGMGGMGSMYGGGMYGGMGGMCGQQDGQGGFFQRAQMYIY